jgi:hypothetical protein
VALVLLVEMQQHLFRQEQWHWHAMMLDKHFPFFKMICANAISITGLKLACF